MSDSRYACINTKIMGIRAGTLKDDDYLTLIRETDITGVLTKLKTNAFYGPYLQDLQIPQDVHRQQIERHLKSPIPVQIQKLSHYLSGDDRDFLNIFYRQYEIESLCLLIRGRAAAASSEGLAAMMMPDLPKTKIPFSKLLAAENWPDFKNALKGTDYYRILEVYDELTLDQSRLMEKTLERYYYDTLNRVLQSLNQKENKALITTLGQDIDLMNLVFYYRGKQFYHLPPEALWAYTLRGGYHLDEGVLRKLIHADSPADFLSALAPFKEYRFLFDHRESIDLYMERRRSRFMYYAFQNLFKAKNTGLGKTVAFIRLLEYETKDIVTIIESKRYGMDEKATEAFLIRNFVDPY